MKKTGSKRVSGYDSGLGSAVLDAPEENYARETEARSPWQGRGPAPAGALHRGYGSEEYDGGPASGYDADEPEYVPKRGNYKLKFRGIPRSVAGRIVFGVVVVGLLGAMVVAVAGVRSYVLHDPRFMVASSDDIQIEGTQHVTRDQVLSVFGADLERNIFRVSLAERTADLERLPWVEHATVMRLLPDRIRVQIKERTPVAFVRQGTQIGLVDAGGVLLDMTPETAGDPHYSFPVLTGLSAELPLDTRAARMQIYEKFMAALRGADEHLTDSLSEVDMSDPEDVKALIASGSSDILVHFGEQNYLKRYQEFKQHLAEWKQQYPNLASADMRYDGQVVLEMQNGTGVTPAADGNGGGAGATAPAAAHPAAAGAAAKPTLKAASLKLAGADSTKAVAGKWTAKKPVETPSAVKKVVAKKVVPRKEVAQPPAWKKKPALGMSSTNEKEFAALAAAHKAALAKAHQAALAKARKSGGARP